MVTIVCTLFEDHYHQGVGALVNSLYKQGYKGEIFAGYRGNLPPWANTVKIDEEVQWEGTVTFAVAENLNIHFLPVITDFHFTNYKPEFLLQVWEMKIKSSNNLSGIFYFDPDIVNECDWEFYERWISYGVALVHESVWNDMPNNHPKRFQWRTISDDLGYEVTNKLSSYINAGFIGVSKNRIGFLKMWSQFIDHSAASSDLDKRKFSQSNRNSDLFSVADQDLLNLTAMCTQEDISEFGPDGMGLLGVGGWLMTHATGSPKPWQKSLLKSWILKGFVPGVFDKSFWTNVSGPIHPYTRRFVLKKKILIKLISFLGRFYKR